MKACLSLLSILAASAATYGQTAASADNGRTVFTKWCAPCHADTVVEGGMFGGGPLPGTAALGVKYKGELPAVLEQRTDLVPEYVRAVVRGGLFGMPITRKTEVSDADLEDIIAYLSRGGSAD